MLKKRERLSRKDFESFFKGGRRYHNDLFTVVYTDHRAFHGAVVVGKKISKKAVVRNKLRRKVYAALYVLKNEKNITGIYIIITKPQIANVSYKGIKEALAGCLSTIHKRHTGK